MNLIKAFKKELTEEAATTRKFLTIIPEDKYNWAPHTKSMTMKNLATHIAELPSWIAYAVNSDELDFAVNEYQPTPVGNNTDLLHLLEKSLAEGNYALDQLSETDLEKRWLLRHGEKILWDADKYEMIRQSFSQTSHHRAQLGVYLRLLNIPIPGSYGPSADDPGF